MFEFQVNNMSGSFISRFLTLNSTESQSQVSFFAKRIIRRK